MTSAVLTAQPASLSFGSKTSLYVKEAKYEFLKLMRTKAFSLSVIGFPVMFYLLFGVSNGHTAPGGFNYAKYLLAGYSCFGLIGAYLFAKILTAIAFSLIITAILLTLGVTLAGVHISAGEVVRLLGITVAGAVPFATMGLFLALVVPANAAPGIVNLIYLPMSFASGLWMPIEVLPHWLRAIAPFLPTYHFAQLALHVVGYAQPGSMLPHWEAMAGFTCILMGLSWVAFSRAQARA